MIIENQDQLEQICSKLRAARSFALDTEFVRERTFYIQLGIIQVATEDVEAVLDPHAIQDLTPFLELVNDPSVEKIVHAGEQDFAVLNEKNGVVPKNVFDTQIAAALVGYGDQISYAKLVSKVTGVSLSKLETLTDWTARPLTPQQIQYSLDDVRYLREVRCHLSDRLSDLGRSGWEIEECRHLQAPETYRIPEPEEYYLRLKMGGLNDVGIGILKQVTAWREREARSRDIPRGWVLRDQSLVEIARRRPKSLKALGQIRSMSRQLIDKNGRDLLEAVRMGLESPVPPLLRERQVSKIPPPAEELARFLEAWLYSIAEECKIAPSIIATRDQLKTLAASYLTGREVSLPVLAGWRREIAGKSLLELLEGNLLLSVEPATGKIRAQPIEERSRTWTTS